MTNLLKVVLFLVTIGILFATASKIGMITMLISSAIFLIIALILFIVWAVRPPATPHRNNLQSFSLNFESKRIEFVRTENGLYQVNLCTLTFDSVEAQKHTYKSVKNTNGSTTYHWQNLPLKLQKFYFTNDKAIQLSDKLLTEKQAKNLFFELLKMSKNHSVVNAVYICKLIESIGKPNFFTANRVRKLNEVKTNIQAKTKGLDPSSLLSSNRAEASTAKNTLMILAFFSMSSVESEIVGTIIECELEAYLYLFAILLAFIKCITKFRDYCENDCVH